MTTDAQVVSTSASGALLAMARPSQLVLIFLVYAAGVLVAVWRHGITDIAPALLGAGLLIPAGVAVHWANEAADEATDALAVRTPFSGGSGALARSGIVAGQLTRWSIVLAAVVMTGTVAVVALGLMPIGAGLLLLAGVVGGMAYSVAPVALVRRGVGEPVNALLGGLLLPLYGVASTAGRVETLDILAFLPFAFVTFCSVMATAWPDRGADGMTGKRTLQVRFSSPRLRVLYAATAVAWAVSLAIAAAIAALPFGLVVFAILPSVWLGWAWYTRRRSPWPSVVSMVGHIVLMAAATVTAIVVAA